MWKIRHFQDTDTLHIKFKPDAVAETHDMDENTLLDVNQSGRVFSVTVEHASQRADIPHVSFEQLPA